MYERGSCGGKILGLLFCIGMIGLGMILLRGCLTHNYVKVVQNTDYTTMNKMFGTNYTYKQTLDKAFGDGTWEEGPKPKNYEPHQVLYSSTYSDETGTHSFSLLFFVEDSALNYMVELAIFRIDGAELNGAIGDRFIGAVFGKDILYGGNFTTKEFFEKYNDLIAESQK